ncbi:acylneuraminate cytidylyltransferase family protein [Maridesulfovibrio sp.]|uniref:acylneuraminate cytidylyltransferase family protein n=1 Tax=Maridesulfovibrio sp. TaxID=2795000 RepID=UPI002A188A10|nr:acylneuraminate cytidylyltransferase family protein [Maridesulfovibrio sp.]
MIAIIPARGGSKGLPGKNIRPLQGKPLIGWTVEAALAARHIDKIILSTDDDEIAGIAAKFGASVPFMRPAELASDTAIADDAYIYTVNRLNSEFGYDINELCILQPTSPLRLPEHIDGAIELFHAKKAEAVIGVCELPHPIEWVKGMDENGVLTSINKEFDEASNDNRQGVSPKYLPNGAVFVLSFEKLLTRDFYGPKTYGYKMERRYSADIDSIDDFEYAEFMLNKRNL